MKLNAKQELAQKQTLSQAQVQSLTVLAMTGDELEQFVQREVEDNPLLEQPDLTAAPVSQTGGCRVSLSRSSGEDEAAYRDIPATERTSLRDHLRSQLDARTMDADEVRCLRFLIDSLDGQGFLDTSAQEVASLLGVPMDVATRCVERLRTLDPPGVGARDLGDCLALQLRHAGQSNAAFDTLLHDYLEDLAAGRFQKVTKETGIPRLVQQACLEAIRTLDPHPAAAFSDDTVTYVVPDLVCDYVDGEWSVQINDRWMGSVGISAMYDRILRADKSPAVQAYYIERLARARFVLTCIEKRRNTLLDIAQRVVSCQADYLLRGGSLHPLTFRQLAEEMGVHESTVSRGVKDKYIQTPRATIPLRELFTTSLDGDEQVSQAQAQELLRDLIAREDKTCPLSDQALAERLSRQGIKLARRTVAKYRESLGIPVAAQRKRQR